MRTVNFNLGKYKNITGELVLEVPGYRERLKMIKECNFKMTGDGTVKLTTETIDSMIKLLDITEKYFKKIEK